MNEFSLIQQFCRDIGPKHHSTSLDVGDDSALIQVNASKELAISTDTMVEGTHFLPTASPCDLAHKLLAVNCSDMAAMGALPKYATLALTLPAVNQIWLKRFSDSLKRAAHRWQVQIIGGDTTRGPLSLSCTIIGEVDKGQAIKRTGAQTNHDVYVSNTLGDAALGLAIAKQMEMDELAELSEDQQALLLRFNRPEPRIELGHRLLGIASSMLDISDGLVADLQHLCDGSHRAMHIQLDALPLSSAYRHHLQDGGDLQAALYGGDDYELAFTAAPEFRMQIKELAEQLKLPISRIGKVVDADPAVVVLFDKDKVIASQTHTGFDHFAKFDDANH